MIEEPAVKIRRHLRSGILVDTNLLLVYFVGLYDSVSGYRVIDSFKHTRGKYNTGDFERLSALIEQFHSQITTPHILTEVSNMLGQLIDPARETCFGLMREIIPSLEERSVAARDMSRDAMFVKFGVADSGIRGAALEPCLVLTDDFPLSGYLDKIGVDVLNYQHVKLLG